MNDEEFDRRYLEHKARTFWEGLWIEIFLALFFFGMVVAAGGLIFATVYTVWEFYWFMRSIGS